MKASFILTLLLLGGLALHAQDASPSVLGSAGTTSQTGTVEISWTLGEMAIASLDAPQAQLTQGFHQPQIVVTVLADAFPDTWEVKAFPNPVSEILHVRWNASNHPVHLRFTNLSGQVLFQHQVENANATQFQVSDYPQGSYFLEVFDQHGSHAKTFKVEVIGH